MQKKDQSLDTSEFGGKTRKILYVIRCIVCVFLLGLNLFANLFSKRNMYSEECYAAVHYFLLPSFKF